MAFVKVATHSELDDVEDAIYSIDIWGVISADGGYPGEACATAHARPRLPAYIKKLWTSYYVYVRKRKEKEEKLICKQLQGVQME